MGEPGAHAERALLERLLEIADHPRISAGVGARSSTPIAATRSVPCPARGATLIAMPSLVERIGIAVEIGPPRRQRRSRTRQVVGVQVAAGRLDGECRERAVADDLGRDALAELALAGPVGDAA